MSPLATSAACRLAKGRNAAWATAGLKGLIVLVRPAPPAKAPTRDSPVGMRSHWPLTTPLATMLPAGEAAMLLRPVCTALPGKRAKALAKPGAVPPALFRALRSGTLSLNLDSGPASFVPTTAPVPAPIAEAWVFFQSQLVRDPRSCCLRWDK